MWGRVPPTPRIFGDPLRPGLDLSLRESLLTLERSWKEYLVLCRRLGRPPFLPHTSLPHPSSLVCCGDKPVITFMEFPSWGLPRYRGLCSEHFNSLPKTDIHDAIFIAHWHYHRKEDGWYVWKNMEGEHGITIPSWEVSS